MTKDEKAEDNDRLSYEYTQLNQEFKSRKRAIKKLQKQLLLHNVVGQSELLVCKGRCDHGYKDEFGNDLFCSIKEKSAN